MNDIIERLFEDACSLKASPYSQDRKSGDLMKEAAMTIRVLREEISSRGEPAYTEDDGDWLGHVEHENERLADRVNELILLLREAAEYLAPYDDEECGDPSCPDCKPIKLRNRIKDALQHDQSGYETITVQMDPEAIEQIRKITSLAKVSLDKFVAIKLAEEIVKRGADVA